MPRPVIATTFRRGSILYVRTYARLDTAVRRTTQLAVQSGYPGDVVEFADDRTGMQLGTVRVRTGGFMEVRWTIHKNALQGD